jgi:uncharacterized protein (DUF58 family)
MTGSQPGGQAPLFDEAFLLKLERLAILSRRAMAGQMQGERRSPKRGQSVEFADFRPYAPGDDFRRIDWNAYARLERFFLKLFVEEQDLTVHLLVDTSLSMDWGEPNKLRFALRAAGALGYVALAGLDRVTVTALGGNGAAGGEGRGSPGYFPPHRGKGQASALFGFLAGLEARGTADFRRSLARYAARAQQPGPLIVVSDLLDSTAHPAGTAGLPAAGLNALAGRGFEVTLLHVLAPDELRPELAGDLKLRDLETGAEVEITADEALLRRYRDGLAAWQDDLRRFCGARGMHYVPVESTVPLEELLFAWLRQHAVLR